MSVAPNQLHFRDMARCIEPNQPWEKDGGVTLSVASEDKEEEEEAETIASFLLSLSHSLVVGFSSDELTPCNASKGRPPDG